MIFDSDTILMLRNELEIVFANIKWADIFQWDSGGVKINDFLYAFASNW